VYGDGSPARARGSQAPIDFENTLFAIKCLAAMLLAFYVAASIGLSRPYWAVTTCFLLAQPFSGAVLTKAVYRLVGTVVGAVAAVLLVLTFVDVPWVLSLAMAAWLGLCVYLSVLDRTPRAYVFVLAGFTTSIIGFQSVDTPAEVFSFAVERVQEISIGVLSGSIVHGAVFPRTVTGRLSVRIDEMLEAAETRSICALKGAGTDVLRVGQAQITADLAELDQLSINLPFDTAPIVPGRRVVRELQDQLSLLLPLASTVDERLSQLRATTGGVPEAVMELLSSSSIWLRRDKTVADGANDAGSLMAKAQALQALADGQPLWREMLILSVLARLSALIAAHCECRILRDRVKHPGWRDGVAGFILGAARGRRVHSDRGLAIRAAAGTATTVLLCCLFWVQTSWVDGAQAALIAAVCCSVFSNVDRPTHLMIRFIAGYIVGATASTFYSLVILPRTTDFSTLAAVLAPVALLLGGLLARAELQRFALGAVVAFPNTVGLCLNYSPDFQRFVNIALAQLAGAGVATAMLALYQAMDSAAAIARLQRASYRDIAARAEGDFEGSREWLDRMLDRVSLLLASMPASGRNEGLILQALKNLRIGYVAGELGTFGRSAAVGQRRLIDTTLRGIGAHFRSLDPTAPQRPRQRLLADIDRTIAVFAADSALDLRRRGLTLLISLRCNLFPDAAAYQSGRTA
jgi:uncharacterized membrane protein YccC